METLQVIATIPAHENPVSSLTLNGSRLYSGSLKSINVRVDVHVWLTKLGIFDHNSNSVGPLLNGSTMH